MNPKKSISIRSNNLDFMKRKGTDNSVHRSFAKDQSLNNDLKKRNFDKQGVSNVSDRNGFDESLNFHKINQKLDKIISNSAGFKQINETIDNLSYEKNILKELEDVRNIFDGNTLTSPKQENEKYKLLEKKKIEGIKKENEDLKKKNQVVNDQMKELTNAHFRIEGEYSILKQMHDSQHKIKEENDTSMNNLNGQILYFEEVNQELKEEIRNYRHDKDNVYRTITNFVASNFGNDYSEEIKNLINNYNNQYFLTKYKAKDEDTVEHYLGIISNLQKKISQIKFETRHLKKLMTEDKAKISKSKISSKSVINHLK